MTERSTGLLSLRWIYLLLSWKNFKGPHHPYIKNSLCALVTEKMCDFYEIVKGIQGPEIAKS